MRSFIPFFIICIMFSACDPPNKAIFNLEQVKIKGMLNNSNQMIALGDTLRISIFLPDTIINSSGTYLVQSVQKAHFYMYINKVDTVNNRAIAITQPHRWTSYGAVSPTNGFNFEFNKSSRPYGVVINIKPPERGLYYLEVTSQPGDLKINDSYEARLFVNFDAGDKHLNLVAPFFGGQVWLDAANNRIASGLGIYAFRVF